MKRPFQIGDKVKVLSFPFRRFGEVVQIYDGAYGVLKIRLKRKSMEQLDIEYLDAFPQQCRRLKPKPNKACTRSHPHDGPCMGKKEARRVWLYDLANEPESVNSIASAYTVMGLAPKVCAVPKRPSNTAYTEFREVLPGEVVVTRETLAQAWDDWVQGTQHEWEGFAKALGLEGKP